MSRLIKAPFSLLILNGIALVGVGISSFLSQHFYTVRNGTAGFKSFCNINQSMNCDLVAASPHAEFIFGLPISSVAAGWFLTLFIFSIIAHNRFWRREAVRGCAVVSLFGTLISIPYFFIMAFQLKTYCLLCLMLDGLNLSAFLCTLTLKPEGFSQHRPNLNQWKILLPIVGLSLLSMVFGLKFMLDEFSFPASEIANAAKGILESPAVSVKSSDNFPSIGPKNAPITIVEFSDFQCPFCRMAAFSIQSVVNRYHNQIRIIFRNFPLDQACNAAVQHSAHPIACEAARVALCAHKQGQFERIYEDLFEQQASFAPGRPLEIAKNMGLDISQMQACIDSPATATEIARDIEEANVLGVKSTPTFFINGHRVEGAMPSPVWNQVIENIVTHP